VLSQAQKQKIREIKAKYEKEGMKEVHGNDGVWRPKTIGEVLRGIYLRVETDADNWNRNKYYFDDKGKTLDQDGQPIALNGEIAVYGSVVFDDRMRRLPTGADVAIIYCGEQRNPGKKNPTKLFTIMSDMSPGGCDTVSSQPAPEMKKADYPAAQELIKDCVTFLADEGNPNPSPVEIVNYAEKLINDSDEPDTQILTEVKILMAEKEKALKNEGGNQ
jgi:hypothetical protein